MNKYEINYLYDYDIECDLRRINIFPFPLKELRIGGLILFLIGLFSIIRSQLTSNDIILSAVGICLILVGFIPKLVPNTSYNEIKGLRKGESIAATVKLEDKILYQIGYDTSIYEYKDIKAIAMSEYLYILITKDNKWIVIKKGSFDIGEESTFIDFLKNQCPDLS